MKLVWLAIAGIALIGADERARAETAATPFEASVGSVGSQSVQLTADAKPAGAGLESGTPQHAAALAAAPIAGTASAKFAAPGHDDGMQEKAFDAAVRAANAAGTHSGNHNDSGGRGNDSTTITTSTSTSDDATALGTAIAGISGGDPTARALRDTLLLILGYRDLAALKLGDARAVFSRVGSPGAGTDAALLGLGWTYVYPEKSKGSKQKQAADDRRVKRFELFDSSRTVATGARAVALRRALVPWQELIGRNPLDPAVQEGMVAIPYALDHLGAFDDALDYRVRAIAMLERIDQALKRSRTDGSIDTFIDAASHPASRPWFDTLPQDKWWLRDSVDPPRAFYWHDVLEDDGVMLALADLQALANRQAAIAEAPADAALAAPRARLHALIANRLQHDDDVTQAYLAEARYALAREYEPIHGDAQ